MSTESPNREPERPEEVSQRVSNYLERPDVRQRIERLYKETRVSLHGPKTERYASHLESLSKLEESARYERAAHEDWLTRLPKEKQEAYFEFMFFIQSLKAILMRYAQDLAEEGPEEFDPEIIDEIFGNLRLEALEDSEAKNDNIKLLAVYYSKIRKYLIKARSLNTKYRGNTLKKHITDFIVFFRLLEEKEQDRERRAAIDQSVEDLKRIREEIGNGDSIIDLEKLEKLDACFLQIPELREVIPHESTMIGRLYGERMRPEALEITSQQIKTVASEDADTPERLQTKAEFLQSDYVAKMFPISEEGEEMLAEALSADLLEYIPKDIPRNLREEFRKDLKALMIGINRILVHLKTLKEINGFESNENKNLQFTLLYGIREGLEKLQKVLEEQKGRKPTSEQETVPGEIASITYEVAVRESELLRRIEKEEEQNPVDILRERKAVAVFGLSHAIGKILKDIDAVFDRIGSEDPSYHPGLAIENCCNKAINKLRGSAQFIAQVFHRDQKLIDMFPEVEEDIAESVKFRREFYAFYMKLASIAKKIESLTAKSPESMEQSFQQQMLIGEFHQVIEDNNDLVSRMRLTEIELVGDIIKKIDKYFNPTEEEQISTEEMAQFIHGFIIGIQPIATKKINDRELLKLEDKRNIEDAIENLFMSKWLISPEEISKERLLRIITRFRDANDNLKKAFYREPGRLIKIQRRLNEISEKLLEILIASMSPDDSEEDRQRKIEIDEDLKKRIIAFLEIAEDMLEIINEGF